MGKGRCCDLIAAADEQISARYASERLARRCGVEREGARDWTGR